MTSSFNKMLTLKAPFYGFTVISRESLESSLRFKLELSARLMVGMYNSFSSFAPGSLRQDVSTRGMNGV